MKFNLENKGGNIVSLGREIGYVFQREVSSKKASFVRPFGRSGYPRFHLYLTIEDKLGFDLHLDQKKPVYNTARLQRYAKHCGQAHDHAAEYDGRLVEEEVSRIKGILG